MNKFDDLAQSILKNVGGSSNILSLTHCVTRLRFKLRDESKADPTALRHTAGIVTVIRSGGQYMVVIGSHVTAVYDAVCAAAKIQTENAASHREEKSSVFHHLLGRLFPSAERAKAAHQHMDEALLIINAPVKGKVHPLASIEDPVFASEVLGKGCAIEPSQGVISAPFDGTVQQIAETKHAVSLVSRNGVEVLIHVGMNTIELKGIGFEPLVQAGDMVQKGQPLLKFDREQIAAAGCSLMTPVIVTNTAAFKGVDVLASGNVSVGQELLMIR